MNRNYTIEPRVLMVAIISAAIVAIVALMRNSAAPEDRAAEQPVAVADGKKTLEFPEVGPHPMRKASGE